MADEHGVDPTGKFNRRRRGRVSRFFGSLFYEIQSVLKKRNLALFCFFYYLSFYNALRTLAVCRRLIGRPLDIPMTRLPLRNECRCARGKDGPSFAKASQHLFQFSIQQHF